MAIKNRTIPGNKVRDHSSIEAIAYNEASGAKKVAEVGRHLLPLPTPGTGTGYTTNVTTVTSLPLGVNLAVYNNAVAVGSITLGSASTVASLAPGVTDTAGNVGIACAPNAWTYIATADQHWVIASAATLLTYMIDDPSTIVIQPQTNAST